MNSHSKTLTSLIQQEILHQGGLISFATFMDLALYHPELGYYNSSDFTLGRQGDFTTAPEISSLFANCFAKQIAPLFAQLDSHDILEIGAGTGRFASDLISTLEKHHHPINQYYVYEISVTLRKKQQSFLKMTCPNLFSRIVWLEQLPQNFKGIVIANEVLDALPSHCFCIKENEIKERSVGLQENQFVWQLRKPFNNELLDHALFLKNTYHLPSSYESEINLCLPKFVETITQALSQGIIFFIDYGYGQKEYYHPKRHAGTLTCFYRHQAHNNPFIHIGKQDITTHVDFTHVIESAIKDNCELLGYTNQTNFLLSCGLIELAQEEEKLTPKEQFSLHQAIKLLTLPTEMGEVVKVMAIGKNISMPLLGFKLADRRRDLYQSDLA